MGFFGGNIHTVGGSHGLWNAYNHSHTLCYSMGIHIVLLDQNRDCAKVIHFLGLKVSSSSPSVQQLLFADDSQFLCWATFREDKEILWCLKLYEEASGHEIKFKTPWSKDWSHDETYLGPLHGYYSRRRFPWKYLGLPKLFSGSKRELLAFITDTLKARLSGWYANTLSFGWKEVLLKSMAMALLVYDMSCFKLAKLQCKKNH